MSVLEATPDQMSADALADPGRLTRVLHQTPVGALALVADAAALHGVYFPGHRPAPRPERLGELGPGSALLDEVAAQLDAYFRGDLRVFDLPLALHGDPFQLSVWSALRGLDYGTTTTYGAIARDLGGVSLSRAVGAAVARNPLCIVIPCHRVVGANGGLTGYAGGIPVKAGLLALEHGVIESTDEVPGAIAPRTAEDAETADEFAG